MLADYLIPVTVALVVTAAVALLGATVLWRRASAAQTGLTRVAASLDERTLTLPPALLSARAALAERGAAVERAGRMIARFDGRAEGIEGTLAQRRAGLDATRQKLEGARAGMQRLKSAARLIMRAIELRRAILG